MKKEKQTKELQAIMDSISKWVKKHNNDVMFVGGFFAEKEGVVVGHGCRKMVKAALKNIEWAKTNKEREVRVS